MIIVFLHQLNGTSTTFTPTNIIIFFYELHTWSRDLNFTLNDRLYGGICSGHGNGFYSSSEFSLSDCRVCKNIITFRADMSSSVHIGNKHNYFLIYGKSLTQGLDDTTLTAEAQYSISFSRSNRKFCLRLHYNMSNSFLFVNATKIYQFQAKD